MIDKALPTLMLIPNMGWNHGLKLNVVNADVTLAQVDNDDFITCGPKYKATSDTLIVKVRSIPGCRYDLGFLPEEGVFVLVPTWIFAEEKA